LLACFSLLFVETSEIPGVINFAQFHGEQDIIHGRDLFANFIMAIGRIGLTVADVHALYSRLFAVKETRMLPPEVSMIRKLGEMVAAMPDLSLDPSTPLQALLYSSGADTILNALFAILEVPGQTRYSEITFRSC
jgi:hypothetical protein